MLDKFRRENKRDYSNFSSDQKFNLISFLIQENTDIASYCEKKNGLDVQTVKKWVNTVKAGKSLDASVGRPPVLSDEARGYIRSLINIHNPET